MRNSAGVEKVEAIKPSPNPVEYRDIASDTTNDELTPGNIGEVSGSRLKYDTAQADEGVYFVDVSGGEGDVKVTTLQKNKPGQLVFLVPTGLTSGTYYLEVRARMRQGDATRGLRIGRLDATLTVGPLP